MASGIGLLLWTLTSGIFEELQSEQAQITQAVEIPLVALEPNSDRELVGIKGLDVGDVFGKLYVPRFGEGYVRNIAEGTSLSKVLNTVGIGHYQGTQMPGEVGNFALAGHRVGNGGPLRNIDKLVAGDLAYVETATTRYTYRFLDSKVVNPEDVGVISAKPAGLTQARAEGKYLTLTTCTPIYINTKRHIAWFELVDESGILVQNR
jgi:sortase A